MSTPQLERAKQDFANILATRARPVFGANGVTVQTVQSQDDKGEVSTTFRIMDGANRLASIGSQYVERDGVSIPHAVVRIGSGANMLRAAYRMFPEGHPQAGKLDTANPILLDANGNRLSEAAALNVGSAELGKANAIATAIAGASVPNPHYVAPVAASAGVAAVRGTPDLPQNLYIGNFLSRLDGITGRQKTAELGDVTQPGRVAAPVIRPTYS